MVYPYGSLPYGHPSWWDGKLSEEDAADYVIGWSDVLSALVNARFWRVEIADIGNTDGYVELSRLFLAPGWQPTFNMDYGAQLGWLDESRVDTALGGQDIVEDRARRRTARIKISNLGDDEAFVWPWEMERALGVSKEIYYIHDPDDTVHRIRRRFLCRMRRLSPIEFPHFDNRSVGFDLVELK